MFESNNSLLKQINLNADSPLFEDITPLKNVFKSSLTNNANYFCHSKKVIGNIANEKFVECSVCFRDFCETCDTFCHSNNCTKVTGELKNYMVYEYASSCHCTHDIDNEENNCSLKLECFYSKFFVKYFSIGKNMFYRKKYNGKIICFFCSKLDHENLASLDEVHQHEIYSNDVYCQCDNEHHQCFNTLDLLKMFEICYESNNKEIQFTELKIELENELKKYFDSNPKLKDKAARLIEYEKTKFLIHNLIYNGLLRFKTEDEIELMNILIEKLEIKDPYFYNYEKISLPLTFIFHYYRKYLFLPIAKISETNIDVMSCEARLRILERHSHFYDELIKSHSPHKNLFLLDNIKKIFDNILKLKNFSIHVFNKKSSKYNTFPIYFLTKFFECYCFSQSANLEILLDIAKNIKFKKNDNIFNKDIRVRLDYAYYTAQNNLFDLYILDLIKNNKLYDRNQLTQNFFFFGNQEVFEDYYRKLFSDEKYYLNNLSNEGISNNQDSNFYSDNLLYLNCFHFDFLDKFFNKKDKTQVILAQITENDDKEEKYFIEKMSLKNIQNYQKNYTVIRSSNIDIPKYRENKVDFFLNKILNETLPYTDINQIYDFDYFLQYLFYTIEKISIYSSNSSNGKFNDSEIDISKFVKKKLFIDVKYIDLSNNVEEIKYIINEFFFNFKEYENNNMLNKWNLLLFLFLSNQKNIRLIFNDVKFVNFLFFNPESKKKNKYLKRSIFNNDGYNKGKDMTWKFFYLACKNFLHKSGEFLHFFPLIEKYFLNQYINSITKIYNKSDEKQSLYQKLNYPLLYYFLKISMKIKKVDFFLDFYPFNFNTHSSEYFEKLTIIAKIIFETNFDVQRYLNTIHTSEYFNIDGASQISGGNFRSSFNIINDNSFKDDTIMNFYNENDKLIMSDKIELKEYETKKKIYFKTLNQENIQYMMLAILGNLYNTSHISIYFEIINKHYNLFSDFLQNKKNYLSQNSQKNDYIYKLELVILKFLFNFISLKHYNFDELRIIKNTNITKLDLLNLIKTEPNSVLTTNIDLNNNPYQSKLMIFRLKCKIFDLIELFLTNLNSNQYSNQTFKDCLGLYLINNFSLLHNDIQIRIQNDGILYDLKEKFNHALKTFFEKSGNIVPLSTKSIVSRNKQYNLFQTLEKFDFEKECQDKFKDLFNNLIIDRNNLKIYEKQQLSYFGSDDLIFKYFEEFLSYNNRKYSIFSTHIRNFLNEKLKKSRNDKISENEDEVSFEFWKNLNINIVKSKSNIEKYIFKYIFNILKDLNNNNKGKKNKDNSEINFNDFFNENFFKMVNFMNNLLYYYSPDFQKTLLEGTDPQNIKILMKIVIKLNYYIIGISDYVDNKTLMGVSKMYFIFMDFLILLCEGISNCGALEDYFFEDFDNAEIKDELNNNRFYENNFYYMCFVQLDKIIKLINIEKYNNFCHGSFRLILQFLYLIRFLKEFIDSDEAKGKDKKKKIIDYCFLKIFDLKWILSENIKNDDYSYILRFELIDLLNTYLEENQEKIPEDFNDKINLYLIDHKTIFGEIKVCFVKAFKYLSERYDQNDDVNKHYEFNNTLSKIEINELTNEYVKDEEVYKDKNFELAEQYYQTLRLIDQFYQSFIQEFKQNKVIKNDELTIDLSKNFSLREIGSENLKKFFNKKIEKKNSIWIKTDEHNQIYFDFLKKIGKEIEIKYQDPFQGEKLKKVYFFKSSKCFWLTKSYKNSMLDEAPRNSIGEKLDYFNKQLDLMLLIINVSFKTRTWSFLLNDKYNRYFIVNLDIINFILVFFVNILLLLYFYVDPIESSKEDLNKQIFDYRQLEKRDGKKNYIFLISFIVTILQILFLTFWYFMNYSIRLMKTAYEQIYDEKYLRKDFSDETQLRIESFTTYYEFQDKFSNFNNEYFNLNIYKPGFFLNFIKLRAYALLCNKETFYLSFCLICNILFLLTNYKMFLVFPILSIIKLNPLFDYFLKAIFRKYKEFLALLIFIYAVEYIFSWVSFLHFQEFMIGEYKERSEDLNSENKNELICSTEIECFLNYIYLGLRLGGGIGDSNPRISFKYDDKKNYFIKFFYDIFFQILINLILGNIFFGVIVDTFNELRDQNDVINADKNNKCFICHQDKYESIGNENFDDHRNIRHGIFNYIYFVPYLLKKNPQLYTRAEEFAWNQINLRKIDWFPYIKNAEKTDEKEKDS